MSAHDDTYVPFYHSAEFSSDPEGRMNGQNSLSRYKLQLAGEGEGIGGTGPRGQRAIQSCGSNLINDGVLKLVVPGGKVGQQTLEAELYFSEKVTGGMFTMHAKIDDTPETCQSTVSFRCSTRSNDSSQCIDGLDLAAMSTCSVFAPYRRNYVQKGLQLTSWNVRFRTWYHITDTT
jgi:hypothetical protein